MVIRLDDSADIEDSVLDEITTAVSMFRQNPTYELSIHVFDMSFEVFQSLFSMFHQSVESSLMKTRPKTNVVDFFFKNHTRSRHIISQEPDIVRETCIRYSDVCVTQDPKCMFRVGLQCKEPLVELPTSKCKLVCLQEVWEFDYKNSFRYIFRKVAQGKTRQTACAGGVTFSVELQLVRGDDITALSDQDIARSVMVKGLDLCGRRMPDGSIKRQTIQNLKSIRGP